MAAIEVARRNVKAASRAPVQVFGFFRRYPVVPVLVILLVLVTAIFAPVLEPHPPLATNVLKRHVPPAWYEKGNITHILGTDAVGRDLLSRIIRGTRITVIVVLAAVSTGVIFGTSLGLMAGYFGGWIDEVIMRIIDAWAITPQLLIILVLALIFGQSMGLLIGVLAMLSWPGAVRLVRAQTLSLRTCDYVALAKVAGASNIRILYRHILPGVLNIVMVSATLGTGTIILTEATLSFLGAGIPPPNPSWGILISDGRQYIREAWWVPFFPGLCIALVVMAGNFLGDWLRDHLDPRLRQLGG